MILQLEKNEQLGKDIIIMSSILKTLNLVRNQALELVHIQDMLESLMLVNSDQKNLLKLLGRLLLRKVENLRLDQRLENLKL
jgi:hypothetical protein